MQDCAKSTRIVVVGVMAGVCAGCMFPHPGHKEFGEVPIDLRDKDTGEIVPEALVVPVWKYTSGCALADGPDGLPVGGSWKSWLAEPYVHTSGAQFQSSQLGGGVDFFVPPPFVDIKLMWDLDGLMVIAPGYVPDVHGATIERKHVEGRWDLDRYEVQLTPVPTSRPADEGLEQMREVLRGQQISRQEDLPFEMKAAWPVRIQFTARERKMAEGFLERAMETAKKRAPARAAGMRPS
jgi:hypothetical protein